MSGIQDGSIGFGSLHTIGIYFDGIFQLRLATDLDPSLEKRGRRGWTFAYDGEPDLDRIIRFNNPVAPRSFVDDVGVIVTSVAIDSEYIDDSLINQSVNLGDGSYFDGSRGADGREPIINFELHVGDEQDYIYSQATQVPFGTGTQVLSPDALVELGIENIDKFNALKNLRIQSLQSNDS